MICIVIDTNVLVSALKTMNADAATARVLRAVLSRKVVPLFNGAILEEYREVLHRDHLKLDPKVCDAVVAFIVDVGRNLNAIPSDEKMPDEDDRVFYEVTLAARDDDAKLVTGNMKHYPEVDFILSPAQFCELTGI